VARIRSIKPEFPQSESMGRVSRDARLLFILLWPICDDHGRTRASSRLLANTLFPYDDDARSHIDGWLDELEAEGCIRRYAHGGSTYLEVCKWLIHQKIDKPSKPQFPAFDDDSSTPREDSRTFVLGKEGKGEEGKGEEREERTDDSGKRESRSAAGSRLPTDWQPPQELIDWAKLERPDLNVTSQIDRFRDYWTAKAGKEATKRDWPATFRNWIRNARADGWSGQPMPAAATVKARRLL